MFFASQTLYRWSISASENDYTCNVCEAKNRHLVSALLTIPQNTTLSKHTFSGNHQNYYTEWCFRIANTNDPYISCTYFDKYFIFPKRSISATITSWESFRTTAPTYFFMGSPFPNELRVFGHSIHRFEWMEVNTNPSHNEEFSEISLICIDFHWISLISIDFHWFSIDFTELHQIFGWNIRVM